MQQGRGAFLLLNNRHFSPKQQHSPHHSTSYRSSHVLSGRGSTCALFINAKQVAPMQKMFIKMGHLQLLLPIQTDNLIAFGIITIQKQQRQWTYGFIGYKIVSNNNNSISTVSQEKWISWTSGPNTLPQPTINTCNPFSSMSKQREHSSKQKQGGQALPLENDSISECECKTVTLDTKNKQWQQPQSCTWAAVRVCWNPKTP